MANCPTCGMPVRTEQSLLRLLSDGFPEAVAVREGLGVPVVDPESTFGWKIFLDGTPVDRVVGFDRAKGRIWRYQQIDGRIVHRDGDAIIEQREGVVTVQKRDVR
jgi:hypothetical protein